MGQRAESGATAGLWVSQNPVLSVQLNYRKISLLLTFIYI